MRNFYAVIFSLLLLSSIAVSAEGDLTPPGLDGAVTHKIQPKETMGTLSRLYGVSPELLREYNDGRRPETGDIFVIPPSPNQWPEHEVSQTQTLLEVAQGYQIPIQQLRQANILSEETLAPGTVVILPRRVKPVWQPPTRLAQTEESSVPRASSRPRRSLKASRAGRPARSRHRAAPHLPNTVMSFGKRLGPQRKASVQRMVHQLGRQGFQVRADDIANFMALETGGTFDPAICSKHATNPAVGLAQFTNIAIKDLNQRRPVNDQLTKKRLKAMSFDEQSQVVTDYLSTAFARKKMQGKIVTAADMYAAIFCPRAIGLPMDGTVYDRSTEANYYNRNRSLDANRDGRISKREMVKRLLEWSRRGEAQRG